MHFKFQNVNSAFYGLVKGIDDGSIPTIRTTSRVGDVLQIVEPVIVTYENPRQRVLFNEVRDCNPFFHVVESLWMLAGRNDVTALKYYASQIGDIASDDGVTFNGAYGYRWRRAVKDKTYPSDVCIGGDPSWNAPDVTHVDQLKILIDHLKHKPESRRAVLQMWNVEDDLLKIDVTKDVCCNLSVMFSLRKQPVQNTAPRLVLPEPISNDYWYLDMTVTNRSNDMIWGMLGANVVHFSFLQEYMACCLGVEVGVYNQISNNLHVYVENNGGFKPKEWIDKYYETNQLDLYSDSRGSSVKLGPMLLEEQECFDAEAQAFLEYPWDYPPQSEWESPFLNVVADPMCRAFYFHKERDYEAAEYWCKKIEADDWRIASTNWINKRKLMWEKKQNA